jgi:predicted nucleic acid-binding protein
LSLYLDTSLLASALTAEVATPRVLLWLEAQALEELTISDWVTAEFSSALAIKFRNREIDPFRRAAASREFAHLSARVFTNLTILPDHFREAARMVDHVETGLRAADALHLAVCSDHSATLCTLDKRLHKAAAHFGVACQLV